MKMRVFFLEKKSTGDLKNSEILLNLSSRLSYLTEKERSDVTELVMSFPSLFLDVPGRTSVIEHDIDVGTSCPVKQNAY